MNLLEQSGRQQSGSSNEPFWYQAAELLLRNVLMVLTAARSHYSLFDVQRFAATARRCGRLGLWKAQPDHSPCLGARCHRRLTHPLRSPPARSGSRRSR